MENEWLVFGLGFETGELSEEVFGPDLNEINAEEIPPGFFHEYAYP